MVDLAVELLSEVRRHTTNVPEYVQVAAISSGCRRFFLESGVWKTEIELEANSEHVPVTSPIPNTDLHLVELITTEDGRKVSAQFYAGRLIFNRPPNCMVKAIFTVIPSISSTEIPDWLLIHRDAIASASLQKLKAQQGQPWYDPSGANYHESEYLYGLGQARIAMTPTTVSFKPFA